METKTNHYSQICAADDYECAHRIDGATSLHAALAIEAWQEAQADAA